MGESLRWLMGGRMITAMAIIIATITMTTVTIMVVVALFG
jgi:hypothetical protein